MAIPGPGVAISMNTIATEFGGTVPHSLNEYYRGGGLVPNVPQNAAIPTSGAIPMGSFYGSTNRVAIPLTIAANAYNYDVFTNRGPTYAAGISDITVTVNPGVTVGSTSTGTYAMLVPSGFNPGDTVTIVNNGVIQGMGGGGGAGGNSSPPNNFGAGGPGAVGGNAVFVNRPTVITNNGTLAGGGGGGGGGAGGTQPRNKQPSLFVAGGGGGGGAGFNGGAGGAGGSPAPPGNLGSPGSSGTSPAGGAGGLGGGPTNRFPGGAGGGRGAGGAAGTNANPTLLGGGGGGAGNYIVGNPFVTYPATGTRQGGVA